jgi:hypothetical protein
LPRFLATRSSSAINWLHSVHWQSERAAVISIASGDSSLRMVGAYRDTEMQTQGPLGVMLADLAHTGLAAHRRLTPLAEMRTATRDSLPTQPP